LLRSHLRAGDIACRHGGEEFLLILPEASIEAAWDRADDLRARVKEISVRFEGRPIGPVAASLGIAAYLSNGSSSEEVLAAADAALYRAKREGRDRVVAAAGGAGPHRG
jgi:diguanylate cyclase (GGDEF)-like protein